jgi:hypothetical protein
MGNLEGFNAATVEVFDPFGPVPENVYRLMITKAELRPNRAETGRVIELEFRVVDGPHEGRRLWERFDYDGSDEKAVKKGRARLATLCRAVGLPEPGDTANLVGKHVVAKVGVLPARDGFEAKNVLRTILEQESRELTAGGATTLSDNDILF